MGGAAVSKQDVEFFDRRQIGEITNRLTADVQEFKVHHSSQTRGTATLLETKIRTHSRRLGCLWAARVAPPSSHHRLPARQSSFKQIVSLGLRSGAQVLGSLISMYTVSPTLTGGLVLIVPAVIGVGTYLGQYLPWLPRRVGDNKWRQLAGVYSIC